MNRVWQQPLPDIYQSLSDSELRLRIISAKESLGSRLTILGHHYQQDAVIEFADFAGDSYELSRRAADQVGVEYVIFCGVHFMAESADILTPPAVHVMLPDLGAGCSMADMANLDQTLECWSQLTETCPDQHIVPVTYMNSSAAIKAFVGEHGGAVCTSSNARKVLQWGLHAAIPSPGTPGEGWGEGDPANERASTSRLDSNSAIDQSKPSHRLSPSPGTPGEGWGEGDPANEQASISRPKSNPAIEQSPDAKSPSPSRKKTKILFFPDQHLGRNTAFSMGYPLDRMCLWDPRQDLGGNDLQTLRDADFILWKGHCSVHQLFRPEHVDQVRRQYPDMKVLVHPECRWEVVQKADIAGSTAAIINQVKNAPPGSQWAIGTEVHLINRLAKAHPEQKIIVLSECQCLCTTMYRIDLPHLCWVLENLLEGRVVNEIRVNPQTRQWATVALQRMLDITGKTRTAPELISSK